jgi:CRP/FNR family transcriptional regulator, anaerobic regulatory protein
VQRDPGNGIDRRGLSIGRTGRIGARNPEAAVMQRVRTDTTSCEHCPLRQRPSFRPFAGRELAFMAQFKQGELVVEPGATVLLEGTTSPHLFTLLDGWAFRHKQLEDGRVQILNFTLPGDLIGLQTAIMGEMQHSVTALTRTVLCVFQRDKVWTVFKEVPELSFAITWLAAREEQLLDGHLLNVGQRPAIERTAYLVLHLYDRAEQVGKAGNDALPAPFRQSHVADALGITSVHLSRTLKKLQARDLLRWTEDGIVIMDRPGLERLACYERLPDAPRPLV